MEHSEPDAVRDDSFGCSVLTGLEKHLLLNANSVMYRQQELMRLHQEHSDLAEKHKHLADKAEDSMEAVAKKLGRFKLRRAQEVSPCNCIILVGFGWFLKELQTPCLMSLIPSCIP